MHSDGIDDMIRLSYLHEPGVLNNLSVRYAKNIIYVSICILKHIIISSQRKTSLWLCATLSFLF